MSTQFKILFVRTTVCHVQHTTHGHQLANWAREHAVGEELEAQDGNELPDHLDKAANC